MGEVRPLPRIDDDLPLDSDDDDDHGKSKILKAETFSHDSESANVCFLSGLEHFDNPSARIIVAYLSVFRI